MEKFFYNLDSQCIGVSLVNKINEIAELEKTFNPLVEENRDFSGKIKSINYYNLDQEIEKQVYYDGNSISLIRYYSNGKLKYIEDFENDTLKSKSFYNSKGLKLYTISYKYSEFGNITNIQKNINDREICLAFKYDLLNRITERTIYLDNDKISTQSYSYDVLNRIITYKDDNQEIYVKKYEDDMLISYSITDKMGNETVVKNNFMQEIYLNTTLVSNGQINTIKDVCYVDNVMLKKPKASEDDLDLILSKLLVKSDNSINTINMNLSVNRKSINLIDENIKIKTLPISIRKRVLYNIAKQSHS